VAARCSGYAHPWLTPAHERLRSRTNMETGEGTFGVKHRALDERGDDESPFFKASYFAVVLGYRL